MSKARNSFERMAQDAATRLDQVRASGRQLALLPDEAGPTPADIGTGKPGRPKGAMGKGSSQLRQWLAARGLRMPEEQLAEIAGLASSEGAMMTAMAQAEQVLAWAFADAKAKDGTRPLPSPQERVSMFAQLYAMQLRAAEALLPYGTPKAAVEGGERVAVQINIPGGEPPRRGDQARDVTPKASSLAPADVRWNIEQNQSVGEGPQGNSDGGNSDE